MRHALLLCLLLPAFAGAETIAIQAGKVYTLDGPPLQDAVVLVRDGKIVAVGRTVQIPEKARRIEARVVLPGLVAAYTYLAGAQIGDRPLDAGRRALTSFDRHKSYRAAVAEGVLTAYIAATGRLVGGQGAVVRLAGPAGERVISASTGLELTLGQGGLNPPGEFTAPVPPSSASPFRAARPSYPSTRMGEMALLRHLLDRAREVASNGGGAHDPQLQVWVEVVTGARPLLVRAEKASDILRVLWLADRYPLRLVLVGAAEAHLVADEIARRKVPVIVHGVGAADRAQPRADSRGYAEGQARLDSAAVLARAGVKVAISASAPDRVGQLLINAALAIRAGMEPEAALAACTSVPAEILGISASHGQIAAGRAADLLLMSDDPFGAGAVVEQVMVAGRIRYRRPSLPDSGATPALPIAARVTAIKAGRVLTVGRGEIKDGVILVSRGKILAIGGPSLVIPQGARVIDARGLVVAPGMIDLDSHIGISRLVIPGLVDRYSPIDSLARAGVPLHLGVRPGDPVFRQALAAGLTAALLAPGAKSGLSGGATLIKLHGKTREEMLVALHAGLKFSYSGAGRGAAGFTLAKTIEGHLQKGKKYTEQWDKYLEKKKKGIVEKPKEVKKTVKQEDPISGTWEASLSFQGRKFQSFRMTLKLEGTKVTGSMASRGQTEEFEDGEFVDKTLTVTFKSPMGSVKLVAELTEPNKLEGSIQVRQFKLDFGAERTSATGGSISVREKDKPRVVRTLEPFRPLFHKEIPAIVAADSAVEIKAVLETFFDKHGIKNLVLISARAGRHLPEELVRRGVPVLLNPQRDYLRGGSRYYLPGMLMRLGIPVALGSGAYDGAVLLPLQAAEMVRRGMPADRALEAVTILPARILGQAHRIGSIEPGKDADLVFWTGHPMALGSRVERVLVGGQTAYLRGNGRPKR